MAIRMVIKATIDFGQLLHCMRSSEILQDAPAVIEFQCTEFIKCDTIEEVLNLAKEMLKAERTEKAPVTIVEA